MGLFQKALETYDVMSQLVGVYETGKEPLAPVSHMIAKPSIEISIDIDGNFSNAERLGSNEEKIIIPVTQDSANRVGGIAPHPLCEQLGYVAGDADGNPKKKAYLEQLNGWIGFRNNEKISAIFKYVSENNVLDDLRRVNVIGESEPEAKAREKDLIRWRVSGAGTEDDSSAVWTDRVLFDDFIDFYSDSQSHDESANCMSMISGAVGHSARVHLKGVDSLSGNAKIVSANDNVNFTYRGRFVNPDEAESVTYEDSQKAHNALKWLIANQGVRYGGNRVFVCWSPQGRIAVDFTGPQLPGMDDEKKRGPSEYRNDLKKKIAGMKSKLPKGAEIVIASFEAATTGRLSVTYCSELLYSDFLDRLESWDEQCCFFDSRHGVRAPSILDIVRYAFGIQRGHENNSKVEVDNKKFWSQQIQRLLMCRIENMRIPMDIMRNLVRNCGSLMNYNAFNRNNLLYVSCCVVRKCKLDAFGEEWSMELEPDKKSRSYQFGRLLAVLEKAEQDTYDPGVSRETNAIRMQAMFVRRPGYAAKMIIEQLKSAYYLKLKPGRKTFYEKLIGEIMAEISSSGEADFNKPLDEMYVLGYYLQKNSLWSKRSDEANAKDAEEEGEDGQVGE